MANAEKARKAMLIINPISGGVGKKRHLSRIIRRLRNAGFHTDAYTTEYAGHAAELAFRAFSLGYGSVFVAGDDGTVNEVAGALRNSEVALGILPCGSGNGLARHLGMPPDIDKAIDVIAKRHIEKCDSGIANGIPFFCTFGTGFDAAVSRKFAEFKRRGPISYVRSAMREFLTYEPDTYTLRANGQEISFRAFIVAVANASQYGNNAFIAPKASITDGLLDITIVHSGNPLELALFGINLFTGFLDSNSNMIIQSMRVKEAEIIKTKSTVHLDGEPMEMPGDVKVKCEPGSLMLYTLPEKKRFRPFLTPILYMMRDAALFISRPFRKAKENADKNRYE